jgi:uracil-DNA glycosylase
MRRRVMDINGYFDARLEFNLVNWANPNGWILHFESTQVVSQAPSSFLALSKQIRNCTLCEPDLPEGANPVFAASIHSKILIVGQAPGIRVHQSGVPFNDPSGDRLRDWMGIDKAFFYDTEKVAIVPMGFCYPGTGKSGDLPPRPECAKAWRKPLLELLPNIQLTLVIGQYAMAWHLGKSRKSNLTETVRSWESYNSDIFPLPHPSPRNNIWIKKNPWFVEDVLPALKKAIKKLSN